MIVFLRVSFEIVFHISVVDGGAAFQFPAILPARVVCEKSSVTFWASFYIHIIIIVFICTNVKGFYFLVLPLNILFYFTV